jgi:four helix bundle protein
VQNYKTLRFWQRAHALTIALNKLTVCFERGHANLRSQLTRAVDSIATNVVEGCGASTKREFARFLDIAIKSANETEYHLLSARDRNLVPPDLWQKHTAETIEIRKMIFAYRKRLIDDPTE